MRVLGVIPARGGSKGIPRKNVRLLAGKPLLHYAAQAALSCKKLDRVVLTTEDEEIAAVGRRCGLEVPFMRPAELALDDTPALPVVQHAVRTLEAEGQRYDAICLLQPTAPLRQARDIDGCIDLLIKVAADSVVTVLRVPNEYNPHWVYFQGDDGFLRLSTGENNPIPRRQMLPAAYHREGSVYVTRRDVLMDGDSLYGRKVAGHLMDAARSVNVDTWDDWARAERLLSQLSADS
jgi:CMP-N,N'-diacetyllegionaminic acid synthase